ncbi:MAG: PAS domain S-box protein [Geminicoccaceae bacterium]
MSIAGLARASPAAIADGLPAAETQAMIVKEGRSLGRRYALLTACTGLPLLLLVLALAVFHYASLRDAELRSFARLAADRAAVLALVPERAGEIMALPVPVGALQLASAARPTDGFEAAKDGREFVVPVPGSDRTLRFTVAETELRGLVLPQIRTYAAILAVLAIAFVLAQLLLQRNFVRPALFLVRHIRESSSGVSWNPPAMPSIWRPWLDAVTDAFAGLRTYEARLRAAADAIPAGLAIFDAGDRLVFHNRAYPEHLSPPLRDSLQIGKHWREWQKEASELGPVLHPGTGIGVALAENESASDVEYRLADGRWMRTREAAMAGGGRVQLVTDITDRRLQDDERRLLATALEQSGDSVEIAGADFRLTFVNAAFTNLTGYAPEEALGKQPSELLRSSYHDDAFFAGIRQTITTGRGWSGRIVSRHKDGHLLHQDATISPLRDEAGQISHYIAVKRDVSAQIQAEAALRASEARFHAAAESIPDGLAIFDAEDRFVYWNSRYPAHLSESVRAVLRPGIRFEDWIRAGIEIGPVYHPDMGEDFPKRRFAVRGTERSEHEQRIIDGRWLRLRESRMPDGGRVLLTTDITAHRQQQQALADQKAQLEAVLSSIAEGVNIVAPDGTVVLVNEGFLRLYDFPAEMRTEGRALADFVRDRITRGELRPDEDETDDIDDMVVRRVEAFLAQQSMRFEEQLSDGRTILVQRQRMDDGSIVSTYMDITELKQRQQENALLAMAVEQVGDPVEITDALGRFTYVNAAFTRLTGYEAEEALGRQPQDLLSSGEHDPSFFLAIAAHIARGQTWQGRIINRTKDGRLLTQETTISPLKDEDGLITHFVAVKHDVTERERAEAELRESEGRYRALVETQTEFVARATPDGRLTFANEAYCRHMGRSREQLLGLDYDDFAAILPEDNDLHQALLNSISPEEPTITSEIRVHLPHLGLRWESWTIQGVFDADGRLLERQAVGTDITERKRAEIALRDSEERYRAVVEAQSEFVLQQSVSGRILLVNDAYCRYLGLSRDQVLAADWNDFDLLPADELARYEAHLDALTPGSSVASIEIRSRLPSGEERWEQWTDRGIFDESGKLVEITSVGRDVTDLHRAVDELRASEARYRAVVEGQSEFILRVRADGTLSFVNDAYCRYRGVSRDAMLAGYNDVEHYRPSEQARIRSAWASISLFTPTATYELTHEGPDGGLRYEEWTDTGIFDANGCVVEYQAVGRDITARKQVELALKESEERFRAVVEDQVDCITRYDTDFRLTFANPAQARLSGKAPWELVGQDLFDEVPAHVRDELRERLLQLTPDDPAFHGENERVLPNGELRWFQWIDRALFDSEGRLTGYQAVGRDITEQKRAEDALKESEERFRAIAESVPVTLSIASGDLSRMLYVNERAFATFGIPSGSERNGILSVWVDPADRLALTEEVMRAGFVDAREVQLRRRDGTLFWGLVSARRMNYGGETAVVTTSIDITERRRTEEALRHSEARLAAFMEHAPVGVHIKDPTGRYLLANPEMERIFGRPIPEVIGHTHWEMFDAVEAAMIERRHRKVVETGQVVVAEEHQPSIDPYTWSMVISFPIRGRDGEVINVGTFALDVTAQKRAEMALKESEARLAAFMQNAPVGMYVKDLGGRYLMANPEMGRVFDVDSVGSMIGRSPEEIFELEVATLIRDYDRTVVEGGVPTVVEEYLEGRPNYTWTMVIRFPIRDEDGNIVQIGGFDVDITAQKRAEQELKASEQRFKAIAQGVPVPISVVSLEDDSLVFANDAYNQTFMVDSVRNATMHRGALWQNPEERVRLFDRVRTEGVVPPTEFMFRRTDGSFFPGSLTTRRFIYDGQPAALISVLDLSAQKAAEAEIERQREALHQSEKLTALGGLLAGVAHELNNPLSVVVGYSSMLQDLAPDQATRTRAEKVHAAAERCARIVKTFLAMARQKPPEFGPVDLNKVIEGALDLAAYGLRTSDVEVVRELDASLPEIWGDGDQLHQVVTNLIVNAQQAMVQCAAPRRLILRTRRIRPGIRVEIEDNGVGMPEEVRKRIFEPFFTTKPQGVGTGVGLSVCHGIVAAHGGRIDVRSRPGQGTRFRILLPFGAGQAKPDAAVPVETVAEAGRGRVLVVDDEPDIGLLVADVLRRDGLTVDIVRSGRAAVERLRETHYDLVVSDLRMPDMDGAALWETLAKEHPEVARKTIVITGDALGAQLNTTIREATVPVLEKPLDLDLLRQQVRHLLEAA